MKNSNSGSKMRKWRYGWFAFALTVLVIAAVAAVNLVIGAAEDKWALKIDASPNAITRFSDETYKVLDELDQDVHVYLVFQDAETAPLRTQLEEIAAKFRARNGHISVGRIDPLTEPNRINKYRGDGAQSVGSGSVIVTNADESHVRLIPVGEMYSYTQDQQTGQVQVSTFNGEAKLTQGIKYVTDDKTPVVYFLTGHEEVQQSYCASLTASLRADNIEVRDLVLGQGAALKPGDTLLIAAPALDLTDDEYKELQTFMDNGGRMLFAQDAQIDMAKTPNFVKLLAYYGIAFKDGVVVEDQGNTSGWMMSPNYVVPRLDPEHEVTKGGGSARLILPNPRAIAQTEMPLSGYSYSALLTTSDAAYVKSLTGGDTDLMTAGPADEVGKQSLAVAVRYQAGEQSDTRIVALGSVYTLVDGTFYNSTQNGSFSRSALNWLINRQDNTYIRGKSMADTVLSIPNQGALLGLSALVVIALPLMVLVLGVVIYLKRRRL